MMVNETRVSPSVIARCGRPRRKLDRCETKNNGAASNVSLNGIVRYSKTAKSVSCSTTHSPIAPKDANRPSRAEIKKQGLEDAAYR